MTHEEAIAKMRVDMQLRGMEKSVTQYTNQCREFIKQMNKPVEELIESDLRTYLEFLNNKGNLSPSTINGYNSTLRFFL